MHVAQEEAAEAVAAAELIITEVRRLALSGGTQLP
jgi:hypothetical protein